MIKLNNFIGQNPNIEVIEEKGVFKVIEHYKDLSVTTAEAQVMDCRQRQILITLSNNSVRLAPGEMQFILGNVDAETGAISVGDLLYKGKMTGNAAIKPLYKGTGYVMTEPTYRHFIIENVDDWGGSIVTNDGMFVCCDGELKDTVSDRNNLSSAVLGREGLYNPCLKGSGYIVLKSPCPREELYEIDIVDDVVKIDANNTICWSESLKFTVEISDKSLVSSADSGVGFVNVYSGTGKILMTPLR